MFENEEIRVIVVSKLHFCLKILMMPEYRKILERKLPGRRLVENAIFDYMAKNSNKSANSVHENLKIKQNQTKVEKSYMNLDACGAPQGAAN